MGVTKQGRIAVLTNWHESAISKAVEACSRGAIVKRFLTISPESKASTRQFVDEILSSSMLKNVGGFSLVCGKVDEPLAILSNRVSNVDNMKLIARDGGETIALSNTALGNRSWPKIVKAEELVNEAIKAHIEEKEGESDLIRRLLAVLSTDTLPGLGKGAGAEAYRAVLSESIFIPAIGDQDGAAVATGRISGIDVVSPTGGGQPGMMPYVSGLYGTQKQTVVLVSTNGRVRYFERTLFDDCAKSIPIGEGDRSFEFTIEK